VTEGVAERLGDAEWLRRGWRFKRARRRVVPLRRRAGHAARRSSHSGETLSTVALPVVNEPTGQVEHRQRLVGRRRLLGLSGGGGLVVGCADGFALG
jgi:hypothetical protein